MTRATLRQRNYLSLLTSQTLGSLNDTLFRIIVSLLAIRTVSSETIGGYLTTTTLVFSLPYLIFSLPAGRLADACSKPTLLKSIKAAEIAIMALALIAFLRLEMDASEEALWILLFVLFLMAVQSSFFSPAKLSYLPEIVSHRALTKANGVMELCRYGALILGTALGGVLLEHWADSLPRLGMAMILIAVAGFLFILLLGKNPEPTGHVRPISSQVNLKRGWEAIRKGRHLTLAVLAMALFEGIGTLVMLSLLLLAKEDLAVGDDAAGAIAAALGLGIGVGSLLTSPLSGPKIEVGLTPIAAVGLAICLILMGVPDSGFPVMLGLSLLLGVFGGIYLVPFCAWIQHHPPAETRGMVIAASNFISMAAVLFASLWLWILHDLLAIDARGIFLLAAGCIFLFTMAALIASQSYLRRLKLFANSLLSLTLSIEGAENLPERSPLVLLCPYPQQNLPDLIDYCFDRPTLHVSQTGVSYFEDMVRLLGAEDLSGEPPPVLCIEGRFNPERVRELLDERGWVVCMTLKAIQRPAVGRQSLRVPDKLRRRRLIFQPLREAHAA